MDKLVITVTCDSSMSYPGNPNMPPIEDVEAMARQPEVAGQIQTAMIIAAALVEGATFFALIVCLIV